MKIVLDTAALITALRFRKGAAAEVLRLILVGEIVLLTDYKLACEYRDVALRAEHLVASGRSEEDTDRFIELLEDIAQPVELVIRSRPMSVDPSDDMVLEVAFNGSADAIVTNNIRHFRASAHHLGVQVLTPHEMLRKLRKENS